MDIYEVIYQIDYNFIMAFEIFMWVFIAIVGSFLGITIWRLLIDWIKGR